MTTDGAIALVLGALMVWAKTAGPMLLSALTVGVTVGILQAATQVNEASISFVLKLMAMGVTIMVVGSWSLQVMVDFTERTLGSISTVVR